MAELWAVERDHTVRGVERKALLVAAWFYSNYL